MVARARVQRSTSASDPDVPCGARRQPRFASRTSKPSCALMRNKRGADEAQAATHLHNRLGAGDLEALARALAAIGERQLDDLRERRVLLAQGRNGGRRCTKRVSQGAMCAPWRSAKPDRSQVSAERGRAAQCRGDRAARTRTFSRMTSGPFTADTVRYAAASGFHRGRVARITRERSAKSGEARRERVRAGSCGAHRGAAARCSRAWQHRPQPWKSFCD